MSRAAGAEAGRPGARLRGNFQLLAVRAVQDAGITVNGCFVLGLDGQGSEAFDDVEVHEDLVEVTLEDLLAHRGGLVRDPLIVWDQISNWKDSVPAARRLVAERLLMAEPVHPVRTEVLYSNAGYMIAGAMLEAADCEVAVVGAGPGGVYKMMPSKTGRKV